MSLASQVAAGFTRAAAEVKLKPGRAIDETITGAWKFPQMGMLAVANLAAPSSGYVGFAAKADGLYQKIGATADARLLVGADLSPFPSKLGVETITGQWNFGVNPTVLGYGVWHAGNFDPSTKAPASGSANYIQNQGDAAQTANMWISGTAKFSGDIYALSRFFVHGETGQDWVIRTNASTGNLEIVDWATEAARLTMAASGAATFASTIQATTAKLTNLTDGYVPYHISDAAGLANSPVFTDGTSVGIGTTAPDLKLSVVGDAYFTGDVRVGTASAGYGKLSIRGGGTTSATYSFEAANSAGATRFIVRDDGMSAFYGSDNGEKVRITESGNVGIGTVGYGHAEAGAYKLAVNYSDATTNTIINALAVGRKTTGTPAAGIGAGIAFVTDNAYSATSELGSIGAVQTDMNNISSDLVFYNRYNNGLGERVRITSTGNVGIGIINPQAKLHIQTDTTGTQLPLDIWGYRTVAVAQPARLMSVSQIGAYGQGVLDIYNSGFVSAIHLSSDGDSYINPQNSGNFGIGTTTPDYKLEVLGSALIGGSLDNGIYIGTINQAIWSRTGGKLALYVNNLDRVTIQSDGSVGIGISDPATKLHVEGLTYLNGPTSNVTYTNAFMWTPGAYNMFRQDTSRNLHIDTYNGGSSVNALTVLQNGNIGIGTTELTGKLSFGSSLYNEGSKLALYEGIAGANLIGFGITSNSLDIYSVSATPAMVIKNTGYVGIGYSTGTEITNYKLAVNGSAYFNGSVTATSLIKFGGTSNQFLKADGSVDSTAYVSGTPWTAAGYAVGTLTGTGSRVLVTDETNTVKALSVPVGTKYLQCFGDVVMWVTLPSFISVFDSRIAGWSSAYTHSTSAHLTLGSTGTTAAAGDHIHPYLSDSDPRIPGWVWAAGLTHQHSNYTIIDSITQINLNSWSDAYTHSTSAHLTLGSTGTTAAAGDHTHSYEPIITGNGSTSYYFSGTKTWQQILNLGTAYNEAAAGNHNHAGVYEPAITGNGSSSYYFSGLKTWVAALNLGTGANEAAYGNHTHAYLSDSDSRISQWSDAYTNMGKVKLFGTTTYAELSTNYFEWSVNSFVVKRDGTPQLNSILPITSGGVYDSLMLKANLSGATFTGAISGTTASFSSTVTGTNFLLSDIRLKNSINRLTDLSWTDLISFIDYRFNSDLTARKRYGVLAQEIECFAPELVQTDKEGIKSVSYTDLLIAKVARLEQRIKILENGN